ncbi:MAG TPA: NYN domain-containing protein [Corynebacteriales bacterium]|nr:NYN domain-containing protein [Mycobacteriales bacterium]
MVDRVEIFVDTSYLLASFYNSWTTGARAQLEIDLPAVTEHLNDVVTKKLDLPVFRQFWYDGIPDSGPHRYQRTLRHIDGVQLRAGQLIEWGDRRTQKGVDTRLVADMVLHAVRGHVNEIVLVSGDADMIPGVQVAIEHGVRVHLIGFGWDSMSNSLRSACDTVTVLDPRDDFEECMHIEVLEAFTPADAKSGADSDADDDADTAAASSTDQDGEVAAEDAKGADDGVDPNLDSEESPEVVHSVPLIRPVMSPGKAGRRGAPARVRTQHAVVEEDTKSDQPADREEKKREPQQQQQQPAAAQKPGADRAETSSSTEAKTEQAEKPAKAAAEKTTAEKDTAAEEKVVKAAEKKKETAENPTMPDADFHKSRLQDHDAERKPQRRPLPSMMAQKRRPMQRSRYVPLPYDEVWESAGNQTPFDIGQQYAMWWYNNAATPEQRTNAHTLTGGGLPTEVDRPLLQFACQTLDAYTLSDSQRVNLRDGFHMGIRGILMGH